MTKIVHDFLNVRRTKMGFIPINANHNFILNIRICYKFIILMKSTQFGRIWWESEQEGHQYFPLLQKKYIKKNEQNITARILTGLMAKLHSQ